MLLAEVTLSLFRPVFVSERSGGNRLAERTRFRTKARAGMLTALQQMDLHLLKRQGHSVREIARMSGYARNTVRAVLRTEGLRQPKSRNRQTKLDSYKEYLKNRYTQTGLSAVRLLPEITAQGYDGGIHAVRRFIATLDQVQYQHKRATVRYETAPGEQAQADWKHVGTFHNQACEPITISAFVMVLSFSRAIFVRFVSSMQLPVLIECHQQAFQFFGGVPASILYDNMKQVRLSPSQWNPAFLDFAGHCGFVPKTHQPYRPRTKGKVERAIRYLDDSFLKGRVFADLADLNAQGRHWCEHTANQRLHATTGQKPQTLLAEEQSKLAPLSGLRPYPLKAERTVDAEGLVAYQTSRYSVPPEYVGSKVCVLCESGRLYIRTGDVIIAEHTRAARPRSCVIAPAHLEAMWRRTVSQTIAGRHAPPPRCDVTFASAVEERPLAVYAEVAG
jgi:transposase